MRVGGGSEPLLGFKSLIGHPFRPVQDGGHKLKADLIVREPYAKTSLQLSHGLPVQYLVACAGWGPQADGRPGCVAAAADSGGPVASALERHGRAAAAGAAAATHVPWWDWTRVEVYTPCALGGYPNQGLLTTIHASAGALQGVSLCSSQVGGGVHISRAPGEGSLIHASAEALQGVSLSFFHMGGGAHASRLPIGRDSKSMPQGVHLPLLFGHSLQPDHADSPLVSLLCHHTHTAFTAT